MSEPVRIRVLQRATREIAEQAAYYREKASAELADRWRAAVSETIRSLYRFPERGALTLATDKTAATVRHIRVTGFPNHLIFYRWQKERQTVLITDVLHGARDLARLLGRA